MFAWVFILGHAFSQGLGHENGLDWSNKNGLIYSEFLSNRFLSLFFKYVCVYLFIFLPFLFINTHMIWDEYFESKDILPVVSYLCRHLPIITVFCLCINALNTKKGDIFIAFYLICPIVKMQIVNRHTHHVSQNEVLVHSSQSDPCQRTDIPNRMSHCVSI